MKFFYQTVCSVFTALFLSTVLISGINAQTNTNENKTAVPPKKAGVKRIGVILPNVSLNNVNEKIDPAVIVRDSFAFLLNSDRVEIIPLEARFSLLAFKEASEKECDYVLKITLTQKQEKKSGFFNRILDKSADSAISQTTSKIPIGRTVGGSVGRETAIGAGQEITQIEFTIKKKDQFILDYQLTTPKAKSVTENSLKLKAQKDNDDVLIPLIEKAANEIAGFLLR